jgi:RNA 2',3'-cyclic 3'-phosphodiesterase
VRLFAGLPLPHDVAKTIVQSFAPLREKAPKARWVPETNLHVTLCFFGDCEERSRAALDEIFRREELHRPAISCSLGRCGQFPPKGAPKVLWVGLEKGSAEAHDLWATLQRLLAPLQAAGEPLEDLPRDDRGFTPHITVARTGNAIIRQDWAEGIHVPPTSFQIEECILYQSLLDRSGARYVPQTRVSLVKGAM